MKPRQLSQLATDTNLKWTASTCGLCSLGCGLQIATADNQIVGVRDNHVEVVWPVAARGALQ
jgi:predicted molibdopterin-dependent oxidoreductase YjgC